MNRAIKPAPIQREIRVPAPQQRAFDVFTAGMGRWWIKSNSVGSSPLKEVVIEPRPGGRWFERGEDGMECEWGKVLVWEPPACVVLAWQLNGEWRYDQDLVTELEVRFLPEGENATRVELEHRNLERVGEKADAMSAAFGSDSGWPGLLKRYAESVAAK